MKKTLIVPAVIAAILIPVIIFSNPVTSVNEKIGLVINSPNQAVTLQELDGVYGVAADAGIARSNVYIFWNMIEPERGQYDWEQSDALMSFNKKNSLKVTLYFSIINGERLGPFPDWMNKPSLDLLNEKEIVSVLDAILSRYDIVDTVILAGETESQFRYKEQNIPVYRELFNDVYTQIKERHPDVKIGNAFALHQVLNKNLQHVVTDLLVGDFVAFSYFPIDSLNDIVKTPLQAREDLDKIFDLAGDEQIGLFEISWSTSDFVGGNQTDQAEFISESFNFYSDNESKIEFFTWYRQNDRPEGTCVILEPESDDSNAGLEFELSSSNEHVIERLSHYICNAGLVTSDGMPKLGWNEFKKQIKMLN